MIKTFTYKVNKEEAKFESHFIRDFNLMHLCIQTFDTKNKISFKVDKNVKFRQALAVVCKIEKLLLKVSRTQRSRASS